MAETSFIIENGRRKDLKDATARKSIGSCSELQTNTKHCLVDAINELNRKVASGTGGGGGGGVNGVTFYPTVDASGNLSWTNDGGLGNPDTVNIKGAPGKDATINGVNALTVEAGENVKLNQSGNVLTIGMGSFGLSVVNGKMCVTYTQED